MIGREGGNARDMTMDAWAWAIVVVGAALTLTIAVVLARQPRPGDSSDQDEALSRRGRLEAERPAGPGAEPVAVDGSVQPSAPLASGWFRRGRRRRL
jgi:hypothetical protein